MTDLDDLIDETAPTDSVFSGKSALDPLASPEAVVGREDQKRRLATILHDVEDGYLPPTVAIYGPAGTGKTLTTRRVCDRFTERRSDLAVEYVNLKECGTLFSAANEILFEVTGERKKAYESRDGVFQALWTALAEYPEWTVMILDEIDHISMDSNYDPSDFVYRLLRGEGRLKRDINLSLFLISNQLLEVDLRLDSRVESAMSDEEVFFGPYGREQLGEIVRPRLDQAFRDDTIPESVVEFGIEQASRRWGDARKALTLFRRAGETANDRGLDSVSKECLRENLDLAGKDRLLERIQRLPENHFAVVYLLATELGTRYGRSHESMPTGAISEQLGMAEPDWELSARAVRDIVNDLELMGLVETWSGSHDRGGRQRRVGLRFEPDWVFEVAEAYFESRRIGIRELSQDE